MELVSAAQYISDCRVPPRGGEHSGRQTFQEYEGLLRLFVASMHLQAGTGTDGAIGGKPVRVLTKQLPRFYSCRSDSEVDTFSQDWSKARGFAIPPWCLTACSLSQIRQQREKVVIITPLWITHPWYPMIRPEPIMFLKLPILLLSNASKISLLCSNYAQSCLIMP